MEIKIASKDQNLEIEQFIAEKQKKEIENQKRKKEIYKARGKRISEALQKKHNHSTNCEQLSLFD